MTDFTKLKMGFSVGLLAALFMLKPLFDNQPDFSFLGMRFNPITMYYLFSGTLGMSAYFFALEVAAGKSASYVQRAGNTMYSLAVVLPPIFAAMYLIALIGTMVDPGSRFAIEAVLTALCVIVAGLMLMFMRSAIGERDRSFSVNQLGDEETASLTKANGLLEAGLHDLVVVQSFQTLELSLRRLLLAKGLYSRRDGIKDLVNAARKHAIISTEDSQTLQDIRVLRNSVVHDGKPVTRDGAEKAIDATRRLITRFGMLLSEQEKNGLEDDVSED